MVYKSMAKVEALCYPYRDLDSILESIFNIDKGTSDDVPPPLIQGQP